MFIIKLSNQCAVPLTNLYYQNSGVLDVMTTKKGEENTLNITKVHSSMAF